MRAPGCTSNSTTMESLAWRDVLLRLIRSVHFAGWPDWAMRDYRSSRLWRAIYPADESCSRLPGSEKTYAVRDRPSEVVFRKLQIQMGFGEHHTGPIPRAFCGEPNLNKSLDWPDKLCFEALSQKWTTRRLKNLSLTESRIIE